MISRVVKKEDYERYSLVLPVKYALGKKRSKFLYGELDKLHPCFSEACCFDSKVFLKNKNVCADVVVMDKLKLAEYRYRYPGKPLVAEECLKRRIFWKQDLLKKWGIGLVFLIFVLIAVLFCFSEFWGSGKSSARTNGGAEINLEKPGSAAGNGYGGADASNLNDLSESKYCGKLFFDVMEFLENQKAFSSEFNWSFEGFREVLSMSVNSIYPEKICDAFENSSLQQVSYKNNVPFLKVSFTENHEAGKKQNLESLEKEDETGIPGADKIREIIFQNKASIIEENWKKKMIVFTCNFSTAGKLLENLSALIESSGNSGIRELCVKITSEEAEFRLFFMNKSHQSTDSDVSESQNVLKICSLYWGKVLSENGIKGKSGKTDDISPGTKTAKTANPAEKMKTLSGNNNQNKNQIGKITHSDGSQSLFYKNSDRKIILKNGE